MMMMMMMMYSGECLRILRTERFVVHRIIIIIK